MSKTKISDLTKQEKVSVFMELSKLPEISSIVVPANKKELPPSTKQIVQRKFDNKFDSNLPHIGNLKDAILKLVIASETKKSAGVNYKIVQLIKKLKTDNANLEENIKKEQDPVKIENYQSKIKKNNAVIKNIEDKEKLEDEINGYTKEQVAAIANAIFKISTTFSEVEWLYSEIKNPTIVKTAEQVEWEKSGGNFKLTNSGRDRRFDSSGKTTNSNNLLNNTKKYQRNMNNNNFDIFIDNNDNDKYVPNINQRNNNNNNDNNNSNKQNDLYLPGKVINELHRNNTNNHNNYRNSDRKDNEKDTEKDTGFIGISDLKQENTFDLNNDFPELQVETEKDNINKSDKVKINIVNTLNNQSDNNSDDMWDCWESDNSNNSDKDNDKPSYLDMLI